MQESMNMLMLHSPRSYIFPHSPSTNASTFKTVWGKFVTTHKIYSVTWADRSNHSLKTKKLVCGNCCEGNEKDSFYQNIDRFWYCSKAYFTTDQQTILLFINLYCNNVKHWHFLFPIISSILFVSNLLSLAHYA